MKILLIVGNGRSGSTILGNVLGSIGGVAHVGELHHIWIRGLADDWLCGCGVAVRRCPMWRSVVVRGFGDLTRRRCHEIDELKSVLYAELWPSPGARSLARSCEYSGLLSRLYESVRSGQQVRVLVDSSKHPCHARIVQHQFGDSLYLLHLVRDPRAVAFSWRRPVERSDTPYPFVLYRDEVETTIRAWLSWNQAIESLARRRGVRMMRQRYEDFVNDPAEAVENIFSFLGEKADPLLITNGTVELRRTHTISSNPARFTHNGCVAITLDDAWRRSMDPEERDLVTRRTQDQMLRYGYTIE